ncbi:zinc finger, RING/FYVE/PHD-type containing protein [Tanacetum coccineum]
MIALEWTASCALSGRMALGEKYALLERCKHGFHVECVEAWLKDHPNCPLCRTSISGDDQDTHRHKVYLKKLYEITSCYSFRVMETLASWLTKSFSQDLQSTLSESCSYL